MARTTTRLKRRLAKASQPPNPLKVEIRRRKRARKAGLVRIKVNFV